MKECYRLDVDEGDLDGHAGIYKYHETTNKVSGYTPVNICIIYNAKLSTT